MGFPVFADFDSFGARGDELGLEAVASQKFGKLLRHQRRIIRDQHACCTRIKALAHNFRFGIFRRIPEPCALSLDPCRAALAA